MPAAAASSLDLVGFVDDVRVPLARCAVFVCPVLAGSGAYDIVQPSDYTAEVMIRRDPTHWHLLQPNWPSDPGY